MSTLIYRIRKDLPDDTAVSRKDRRQVRSAIILVAVGIGPGVFMVDRLAGSVAWRSFLAEALSLCLYAAVAVWYGLRYRPGAAWRVALTVYLVGLAIMGLTDVSTKSGLSTLLVDSPRAHEPVLWIGALMLLFIPMIAWVAWRYPPAMNRIGINLAYPFSRLGKFVLVGLGVGLLISFHFWLTARAADLELGPKPWPYVAWQVFYEAGPQSLTEELFMRGVVFNELYFGRQWNFWAAALTVSGLELLSLVVKQDYSADLLIILGAVLYTVVSSVASAGLFRWSRSVVPGYANNLVFGVATLFR